MKLIHHIVPEFPRMYNDFIANTMYCLMRPTEWGSLHIAAIRPGDL